MVVSLALEHLYGGPNVCEVTLKDTDEVGLGPLLLTWFNFNPNMGK